jgi:hypothetical protein
MKLLNFELAEPSFAIELIGLDFVWDLHNAGEFLGISLSTENNAGLMKWTVTGHPVAKYSGCSLVFCGLKQLIVSARDQDLPFSEDTCLSSISKVVPELNAGSPLRIKPQLNIDEEFHLLFEFQSRRSFEIAAETAELVGW